MGQGRKTEVRADRRPTATAAGDTGGGKIAAASWSHLYLIIQSDRPLDGGARFWVNEIDEIRLSGADVRATNRERRGAARVLSVFVPSHLASESHAFLKRTPMGWTLTDLGSKNGTFVNGDRISGPREIQPGDIIQIGRVFFTFRDSVVHGNDDFSTDVYGDASAAAFPNLPTLLPTFAWDLARIRSAAATVNAISIIGLTGTGKDVLSNAIHAHSGRKGAFVPVNCAALTASLVEGQLFGYVKGAYSGADRSDPGFIRSAHEGTLFLDEVLDLPLPVQAKLLRVLQQGEVVSLGTARRDRVDLRVISASQRPLKELVASGQFRADFQSRIEDYVIHLPCLSERREDVGLLVAAVLRSKGVTEVDRLVLSSRAVLRILGHSWPLNIRDFERCLGRALHRAQGKVLADDEFPDPDGAVGALARPEGAMSDADRSLRDRLIGLMQKHGGNVAEVARELDIHRPQVYRLLLRFRLSADPFRSRVPA
jgi:transcriptional regulator with AAA-type ATPase domain